MGAGTIVAHSLVAIPRNGVLKGETRQMHHAVAMYLATNHILDLQAEAAASRLAKQATRTSRESRVRAIVTSVRSLLSAPTETPTPLPKLTDYPYRS